ncbi:MAG: UDP-3-O-(3-hydroxymyristoyl)glucosamine N-acyltransferase [Verrucomicrobiales bacterium]|nr:UDP-3-O-(3-hydroxymyristoyl)glucosamine N-acyltransferase [Verrucomicrobiales bacterium]
MSLTADQVAQAVQGKVIGDGATVLTGVAPAAKARRGDLTFAENAAFFQAATQSEAAAILVSDDYPAANQVLIRVKCTRIAMARLLPLFVPEEQFEPGIHAQATVHATAQVDPSAHVGPWCVVGPEAKIGARTVLMGGNHLGRGATVGQAVRLYPNVVVYAGCEIGDRVTIHASTVIGSDGYGYVFDEGRHRKVPQVGNVVIHADVEIGSNASIDRAALGSTIIGQGTKIDNLVHVAHNVEMGRHCLVMGQVGFAGSTRLGDYCVVASQSGIAGHLTLGHQATVGAKSGVMRDVPDKGTVLGIPAQPDKQTKRQWISLQQLPELVRRVRELEKKITSTAT